MGGWSRLQRPWVAAVLIVVAGIVGGVVVYRAGGEIREQDRAAFLAWERMAQPSVERAREIHDDLPTLAGDVRALPSSPSARLLEDVRTRLTKTRLTLEHARNRIQTVRIERVLRSIAAAYLEAIARDLQAVSALEQLAGDPAAPRSAELARAEQRHATAGTRFREGDDALEQLRARLRFED